MINALSNITRAQGDPRVISTGPSSLTGADRLARALGWLSIGLGVTEVLAPGMLARRTGLRRRTGLLRAFGARELLAGVLTLSVDKELGLWSRIAGDALDLVSVLPDALSPRNPKRGRAALTLLALAGVAFLDAAAAQAVAKTHARGRGERRSYRDRSGFPKGVQQARLVADAGERGVARAVH